MKTKYAARLKSMLGVTAAVTLLTLSSSALTAAQAGGRDSPGFAPWEKQGEAVAQFWMPAEPGLLTSVQGFAPWAYSRGESQQEMLGSAHDLAAFEVIEGTSAGALGFRPWDTAR